MRNKRILKLAVLLLALAVGVAPCAMASSLTIRLFCSEGIGPGSLNRTTQPTGYPSGQALNQLNSNYRLDRNSSAEPPTVGLTMQNQIRQLKNAPAAEENQQVKQVQDQIDRLAMFAMMDAYLQDPEVKVTEELLNQMQTALENGDIAAMQQLVGADPIGGFFMKADETLAAEVADLNGGTGAFGGLSDDSETYIFGLSNGENLVFGMAVEFDENGALKPVFQFALNSADPEDKKIYINDNPASVVVLPNGNVYSMEPGSASITTADAAGNAKGVYGYTVTEDSLLRIDGDLQVYANGVPVEETLEMGLAETLQLTVEDPFAENASTDSTQTEGQLKNIDLAELLLQFASANTLTQSGQPMLAPSSTMIQNVLQQMQ